MQSEIKFVKLDGSMSMAARDQMIETFTNDADTKVCFRHTYSALPEFFSGCCGLILCHVSSRRSPFVPFGLFLWDMTCLDM